MLEEMIYVAMETARRGTTTRCHWLSELAE